MWWEKGGRCGYAEVGDELMCVGEGRHSACRETKNKMCMCERETLVPFKDPRHYSVCTQERKP